MIKIEYAIHAFFATFKIRLSAAYKFDASEPLE